MPRPVVSAVLIVVAVSLLRAYLAGLQLLPPTLPELLAIPAMLGLATFLINLMPEATRLWLFDWAQRCLSSQSMARALAAALAMEVSIVLALTVVDVVWTGPPALEVSVQGSPRTLHGKPLTGGDGATWRTSLLRWSFVPISVQAGAYVHRITPTPFRRSLVTIPGYLSQRDEISDGIEADLDLVLLQLTQHTFHQRAKDKLGTLKDRLGPAQSGRLQDLAALLEESVLRSRDDSETPRNLLIAYESRYPLDPWLRALRATVHLSQRRYALAASALSEVLEAAASPGVRFPSRAGVVAMYAVARIRQARDVILESADRAKSQALLADAKHALTSALGDSVAVRGEARAALRWHLGLVDFYAGSDDAAIEGLAALGTSQDAGSLIVARAKNAVGYLVLLKGRLSEADQWFYDSSSIAPGLAAPRINRAYLMLIRGQYRKARQHLTDLIEGNARLPAERDRLLARLALGIALDAAGDDVAATHEYERALTDTRGTGAIELDPAFKPALVRVRLAKEVYLRNRDYYALEVWGAVMLGSACSLLCSDQALRQQPAFVGLQEQINEAVRWTFVVSPPRPELLQHREGVMTQILTRRDNPCQCDAVAAVQSGAGK